MFNCTTFRLVKHFPCTVARGKGKKKKAA